MSASLDLPFPIGAEVWISSERDQPSFITCPECSGKKFHLLVLGCGDEHRVKCHVCGSGYQDPSGLIKNPDPVLDPVKVVLTGVHSFHSGEFFYTTGDGGSLVSSKSLHATREQCQSECYRRSLEIAKDNRRRILANAVNNRDFASFTVSYQRKQFAILAKKLEAMRLELATGV